MILFIRPENLLQIFSTQQSFYSLNFYSIIEPFCTGKEFTIIILQNHNTQEPVALMPSEIEMKYENYQIFDYRRKYLPTEQTRYHNPARFSDEAIQKRPLFPFSRW